jgi:GntR family transcriptional regulator, transcriptional repressor for pyruvate dehydrogenase complex
VAVRNPEESSRPAALRGPHQVHRLPTPRIGEAVAARLREQILSGGMQDGSELPTQERLVDEFRMSKQAVREGLHILELEGLITIRRGNVGGALVHLPSPIDAAYNFALVMQARAVRLEDVGAALTKLEPICVGLCAERADRLTTVVPRLRAAVEESVANITDLSAWLESQSLFHRILASDCGNEAMAVLAGALEAVWLTHVRVWAEGLARLGEFPDAAARFEGAGITDHEKIISLIEQGDAEQAVAFAQHHMEDFYTELSDFHTVITASTLAGHVMP